MKHQSLILKTLGASLLAILAIALYCMPDQISITQGWFTTEGAGLLPTLCNALPFAILLYFFIVLKRDNPDSKSANYALLTGVIAIGLVILSHVLLYNWNLAKESCSELYYTMTKDMIEVQGTILDAMSKLAYNCQMVEGILLVVAMIFVADTVRNNKRLLAASFFVLVAVLFSGFYTPVVGNFDQFAYIKYYEDAYILTMIKTTLCVVSFAYLLYAYSQKDAPKVAERRKYSGMEWIAVSTVCLAAVFFFCNWIDGEDVDLYYVFGAYVVPFAAVGLMVVPIALISVLERNSLAKKISGIALIAWPFVVGVATWMFDTTEGYTVGDVILEGRRETENFWSQFMGVTNIQYVILYTVCSILAGIFILTSMREVKKPVSAAPRRLTKDEEIAKLQAELAALKNQLADSAPQDALQTEHPLD